MTCETGKKLQQGLRDAISTRVIAEAHLEMAGREERVFIQRWDEFSVAKEDWGSAVLARHIHVRNCVQCLTSPPK
jgi:hypothetical protein